MVKEQTVTEKPRTAGLLCRVSSPQRSRKKEETDPLKSTARQEVICRDLCVKQGLEVAGVYMEEKSATGDDLADRPEMERLLKDAEAGRFSYLVAFHADRVTRNMDGGSEIAKRLRQAGVILITPQGATDFSDRTSKLVYAVQSWSSEGEAERITTRTWGAKKARGKARLFAFYQRPFGYSWDPKAARPVPIEAELEQVRHIFALGAKHNTRDEIARILFDEGRKPRQVNRWTGSLVSVLLADERYTGKWVTWSGDYRPPKQVAPDPDDAGKVWTARPDLCPPPAVSRKVWLAAQKAKQFHRQHPRREVQSSFLLGGGLATCTCGAGLVGRVISSEPARRYYACSMAVRAPNTKSDCAAGYIPAQGVEEAAWAYVERLLEDPDLLRRTAALTEQDQRPAKQEEKERLDRAIAGCEQQIETLLDKLGRQLISDERFQRAQAKADQDLAAWTERRDEVQAWLANDEARQAAVLSAVEVLEAARGKCENLEERRRLLELLDFRATVSCADWTAKAREREYSVALDSVLFSYDPEATGAVAVSADFF
jgi:site-specific DNA recombinase